MNLGRIEYDAQGVMCEPKPSALKQTPVYPGGVVETTPGFYHAYKVETVTYEALVSAAARLNELLETVENLAVLSAHEYTVDVPHRYGLKIIYVVTEPAATRTRV